ncbi:NYN domain-containing protein [Pseudogracilibacillus sp. ICA-222130]|uniref:NYN domain-containing protein n=1 Tax=Pseudogracilibacillus sp. ICA-222130 TaxID=3134655 RepID=UPI0030C4B9B9
MNVVVVDGYNVIGAWEDLNRLKQKDIGAARHKLIEMLAEYRAYTGDRMIVVFDALYVKGIEQKTSQFDIEIIYTKEEETADECIERLVRSLKTVKNQVYVVTSDYLEQTTIFSRGALRISARELFAYMDDVETDIQEKIVEEEKQRPRNKIIHNETNLQALQALRKKLSK